MNKSAIEWTDFTWNPVVGCLHGCSYCYARKMVNRFSATGVWPQGFKPTFYPERLDEPKRRKAPAKIFVCSMADLFGAWVPSEWIESVLAITRETPQHTYQFLTKDPRRLPQYQFPRNAWVGVTVTAQADVEPALRALEGVRDPSVRFLSFEPFLGRIDLPCYLPINWAIVGGLTGARWNAKAMTSEVSRLVEALDCLGIPVFQKPNLREARARWAVASGVLESWPDI